MMDDFLSAIALAQTEREKRLLGWLKVISELPDATSLKGTREEPLYLDKAILTAKDAISFEVKKHP
jgi:hypothetical protein